MGKLWKHLFENNELLNVQFLNIQHTILYLNRIQLQALTRLF